MILWNGYPPHCSFIQTQFNAHCTPFTMPNLPTTLSSYILNTSQTTRSTIPLITSPTLSSFTLACRPGTPSTHLRQPRLEYWTALGRSLRSLRVCTRLSNILLNAKGARRYYSPEVTDSPQCVHACFVHPVWTRCHRSAGGIVLQTRSSNFHHPSRSCHRPLHPRRHVPHGKPMKVGL